MKMKKWISKETLKWKILKFLKIMKRKGWKYEKKNYENEDLEKRSVNNFK